MSSSQRSKLDSEISLLMKIQHKNLLKCISSWTNSSGQLILITELIQGSSIKNILKRIDRPRLKLIKYWCKEILLGINYLHYQSPSIVHRNIRPENIYLISNTGEIRVGDFSSSTTLSNLTACTIVGTPEYMAPEIYEGSYDTSIDIYAYGMCVLEICTGEHPYAECANPAAVYKKVMSRELPNALDRICDDDARDFIQLCLSDISRRPTSRSLLSHPFLRCDDKEPRVHQPLLLKQKSERCKNKLTVLMNGTRLLELSLIISEQGIRSKTKPNEVKFFYNLDVDKPELVAQEMISQLSLDPASYHIITNEIESKLFQMLSSNLTVSSYTTSEKALKRTPPTILIPDINFISHSNQPLPILSPQQRSVVPFDLKPYPSTTKASSNPPLPQFSSSISSSGQTPHVNLVKSAGLKPSKSEANLIL